jgi:hypothetical protein
MKTIFTIIALLFAFSSISFAQQQGIRNLRHEFTPEELEQLRISQSQQQQAESSNQRQRMNPEDHEQMLINSAQRQTERLKELLTLDEEQEKTINEIHLRYAVLRVQVSEATRAEGRSDLRELLSELDEKKDAEILPVLDENQIVIFLQQKKEQEERREQMRGRMDERRQRRTVE